MPKITKAIAVLGIVAGLGVSAIPLSAYAEAGDAAISSPTTIQATVDRTLAIAVANVEGSTALQSNTLNLGKLTVNGPIVSQKLDVIVYANDSRPFVLTMAPATASKTAMYGTASSANTIPTKSSFGNGTAGWGWRMVDFDNPSHIYNWNALASSAAKINEDNDNESATPDGNTTTIDGKAYTFSFHQGIEFGAAADSTTKADTYSAKVIFTATAEV